LSDNLSLNRKGKSSERVRRKAKGLKVDINDARQPVAEVDAYLLPAFLVCNRNFRLLADLPPGSRKYEGGGLKCISYEVAAY
jgi:hypothetical protein